MWSNISDYPLIVKSKITRQHISCGIWFAIKDATSISPQITVVLTFSQSPLTSHRCWRPVFLKVLSLLFVPYVFPTVTVIWWEERRACNAILILSIIGYHKRLVEEFSNGGPIGIHLCGDATHHFKFLKEHLRVNSFDTVFPVDHGELRQELGPDVQMTGGPTVMLLKEGTPSEIRAEVKRKRT